MALHSVSDKLLPNWIEWSRQSDKFVDGECEKKWNSFNLKKESGIRLGTLIYMAKEDDFNGSSRVVMTI